MLSDFKLHRVKQVTKAAENGNIESMYKLGLHYVYVAFDESAEDRNFEGYLQALYWLSEAAHSGIWEAYYWLGTIISDFGLLSSGGGYFVGFLHDARKNNPLYRNIINKLKCKGLHEDSNPDIYEVNQAFVFLYCDIFYSYHKIYDYRDISTQYFKIAAAHGVIDAYPKFARICYSCWMNWCELLSSHCRVEALGIVKEEGASLPIIKQYYEDARYWLLKSIEYKCDWCVEWLQELIQKKNSLDFLEKSACEE